MRWPLSTTWGPVIEIWEDCRRGARLREGLETSRQIKNDSLSHSLETNLALVFQDTGKFDQAEEILTRSVEYCRRTYGDDSADTAKALFRLAGIYRAKRQPERAEALAKDALERYRAKLGPEHPNTLAAVGELASAYWSQKKFALVEPLLIENLAANRRVWGEGQRNTVEAPRPTGATVSRLGAIRPAPSRS